MQNKFILYTLVIMDFFFTTNFFRSLIALFAFSFLLKYFFINFIIIRQKFVKKKNYLKKKTQSQVLFSIQY